MRRFLSGILTNALKFTGGSPADGKLLKSDADGDASWSDTISVRENPRVATAASATSVTPNIANYDQYTYTALTDTLTINAPTGTPVDGNKLLFRIEDDGTTQTLTWNAAYVEISALLPTETVPGEIIYVGTVYNADTSKWDVIAGLSHIDNSNSIVVKEAVSGSVNGSNVTFTTVEPYIAGTLQVYVNGLAQSGLIDETNPGIGEFELDTAPLTGDDVKVYYLTAGTTSGNADTVDNKEASELSQVGDIIMSLRTTPGTNRLFMDGGTYNKDDWPLLWDVVDNNAGYGSTDASTFTLVDMRERSVIGQKDAGSFATLGDDVGAATHTHALSDSAYAQIAISTSTLVNRRMTADSYTPTDRRTGVGTGDGGTGATTAVSPLRGTTDSSSNVPPSTVINYEVIAG